MKKMKRKKTKKLKKLKKNLLLLPPCREDSDSETKHWKFIYFLKSKPLIFVIFLALHSGTVVRGGLTNQHKNNEN